MSFFKHPQAIVESDKIGKDTRVWAFAHILPNAVIGENCNICDHTFIESDVKIGNNVTVKCGVQLWDGVEIEDDVFIGPNVTFTNDPFPRSRQRPVEFPRTVVKQGASIGANATILPGIVIGRNSMVGAGAVVTKDVPANGIVRGNPAQLDSYIEGVKPQRPIAVTGTTVSDSLEQVILTVKGVKLSEIPIVEDLRGSLTFGQFPDQLPFVPKRYFVVYDVPNSRIHGEHAHRTLKQLLICLRGSIHINVNDGKSCDSVILDSPGIGLYLPPMVWATQYKYTADALLLVLASDIYDPEEYIRNYDEYIRLRGLTPETPK